MNRDEENLRERAEELRTAFDQSFAAAPADAAKPTKAFLAIRVAGDPYALDLTGVAGVFVDKKIVTLPSASLELLGIASFRGAVVPIYDLRILLGYPGGAVPRWSVLVAPGASFGLAFDDLDSYLNVPLEAIAPTSGSEMTGRYLAETLSADGILRPVVSVPSILQALVQSADTSLMHGEK